MKYRNKKNKKIYRVIFKSVTDCTQNILTDRVIYFDVETKQIWSRLRSEFDQKFTKV